MDDDKCEWRFFIPVTPANERLHPRSLGKPHDLTRRQYCMRKILTGGLMPCQATYLMSSM